MRTHAAECLLYGGATLLEASNVGGTLNYVRIVNGRLKLEEAPSGSHSNVPTATQPRGRGKPPGTVTSDIRIADPEVHVEIKARCAFTSSNANLSAPLVKDLRHTIDGIVDAFFLAIDASVYERLRSDKAEKRGDNRSPDDSAFFDSVFEHVDAIPDGAETPPPYYKPLKTTRGELLRRHLKIGNTYSEKRILLCFAHPEPDRLSFEALLASSVGARARQYWAGALSSAASDPLDRRPLVSILRLPEAATAHTAARKALRLIDTMNHGPSMQM